MGDEEITEILYIPSFTKLLKTFTAFKFEESKTNIDKESIIEADFVDIEGTKDQ